ncbi:MAG TPA: Nif3-like dinuclear metal center hexameric protein, partial [Chitinophagales bacterium]|nr:Nif3-like dinuclear metal center hexameric protein [Chitinophagales bacterium]
TYLETIAPLSYQESYDNSGLIVGDANAPVKKVLITLDATEAVIDEAIREKCQLVIAHHPIVFGGLKKFNGKNYVERVVIKAIKNNIAIYAIHTNYDNVIEGVNAKICERIGLTNCQILAPKKQLLKKLYTFIPVAHHERVTKAVFEAGTGYIGNYSETSFNVAGTGTFKGNEKSNPVLGKKGVLEKAEEIKFETIFPAHLEHKVIGALLQAHPYEEVAYDVVTLDNAYQKVGSGMVGELKKPVDELTFLKNLKKSLKTDCIRYTALQGKPIKKVAVCGGAGSFLLNNAIAAGADAFVTADFKYHEFFNADNKLVIADVGHYESEQFTRDLLLQHLSEKFPILAALISSVNTNPIKYL